MIKSQFGHCLYVIGLHISQMKTLDSDWFECRLCISPYSKFYRPLAFAKRTDAQSTMNGILEALLVLDLL